MHDRLSLTREAIPYLLYQRTAYLQDRRIFRWLTLLGLKKRWYKMTVRLKSMFYSRALADAFRDDMQKEYGELKPFLPSTAEHILDIGCGLAGIDVHLSRHYPSASIYLLDKTGIDDTVYYAFEQRGSVYNSLDLSRRFLVGNGVPESAIHIQEATPNNEILFSERFDIIISLISWGFHYPVATYLAEAKRVLKPGGVLILDIRKDTDGVARLKEAFSTIETIAETNKSVRVLARA